MESKIIAPGQQQAWRTAIKPDTEHFNARRELLDIHKHLALKEVNNIRSWFQKWDLDTGI